MCSNSQFEWSCIRTPSGLPASSRNYRRRLVWSHYVSAAVQSRIKDGEVPETPEESWQRKTFFVALDTILASMRRRFDKNRSLFETLAIFCDTSHLNTSQCLQELLSFAAVYHRFHTPSSTCPKMDVVDDTDSLNDDTGDDGIAEEDEEVQRTSSRANPVQVLVNWSFLDALNLLCNPTYHLYDAFPEFCKIYSIAIAIPISTCTAERSFSALKLTY